MKTRSAVETAQNLLSLIADWGPPKRITADAGGEFSNKVLTELFEFTHIEFHISTPKFHGSTGSVERVIRTLRFSLRKMLDGAIGIWDIVLPLSTLYYNISTRSLHKSTPYVLMFARDYNSNENTDKEEWVNLDQLDDEGQYDEWLEHQLEMLQTVYPTIREVIQTKRHKQAKSFEKRHKIIKPFQLGDTVMLYDHNRSGKDDPLRVGPYTITEITPTQSYLLSDGINMPILRHASALRLHTRSSKKERGMEAETSAKHSQPQHTPQPQQAYEVEEILDYRGKANNRTYLVKWRGYDRSEATWEPVENFLDTDCIKRFWRAKAPARVTKRSLEKQRPQKSSGKRHKRQ
jgi:hypothetical protein